MSSFSELPLRQNVVKIATQHGWHEPVGCQKRVIRELMVPTAFEKMVRAEEGSGVSTAVLMCALSKMNMKEQDKQILVLTDYPESQKWKEFQQFAYDYACAASLPEVVASRDFESCKQLLVCSPKDFYPSKELIKVDDIDPGTGKCRRDPQNFTKIKKDQEIDLPAKIRNMSFESISFVVVENAENHQHMLDAIEIYELVKKDRNINIRDLHAVQPPAGKFFKGPVHFSEGPWGNVLQLAFVEAEFEPDPERLKLDWFSKDKTTRSPKKQRTPFTATSKPPTRDLSAKMVNERKAGRMNRTHSPIPEVPSQGQRMGQTMPTTPDVDDFGFPTT